MVKGITRRVMLVNARDGGLFEQAIFLLKEETVDKQGVTEQQIIEEVERLSQKGLEKVNGTKRSLRLQPLVWSGLGAGLTGLIWILTYFIV